MDLLYKSNVDVFLPLPTKIIWFFCRHLRPAAAKPPSLRVERNSEAIAVVADKHKHWANWIDRGIQQLPRRQFPTHQPTRNRTVGPSGHRTPAGPRSLTPRKRALTRPARQRPEQQHCRGDPQSYRRTSQLLQSHAGRAPAGALADRGGTAGSKRIMGQDVIELIDQNGAIWGRVQQASAGNEEVVGNDQEFGGRACGEEQRHDEQEGNEDIHHHRRPETDTRQTDLRERQGDQGVRTSHRRHSHQAQRKNHQLTPFDKDSSDIHKNNGYNKMH